MQLSVSSAQNIGLRSTQEDYFRMDKERGLFVIADGMGGHSAGEVASQMAAETFVQGVKDGLSLVAATMKANTEVYSASLKDRRLSGMGTTLTGVRLSEGTFTWAHVGDSRLYLQRAQHLNQLTEDHLEYWDLLDRDVLTRSVGTEMSVRVDTNPKPEGCQPGDKYLLCTDGLHVLPDHVLNYVLLNHQNGAAAVDHLVDLALRIGSRDNITVILVQVLSL